MTSLGFAAILAFHHVQGAKAGSDTDPVRLLGQGSGDFDLDYSNTEVRVVLKRLFKAINTSYSIAPDVQGNVNLHLKDALFGTALDDTLRQVNASYTFEGGVFMIMKLPRKVRAAFLDEHIDVVDFKDIEIRAALKQLPIDYVIDSNVSGKVSFSGIHTSPEMVLPDILRQVGARYTLRNNAVVITKVPAPTAPGKKLPPDQSRILHELICDEMDVRDALKLVFVQAGCDWVIDAEISGKISLRLTHPSVEEALRAIVESIDATYTVENNVIHVRMARVKSFGD